MTERRRINTTLTKQAIRRNARAATRKDKSPLIPAAVQRHAAPAGMARFRRLLKEGAIRNSERDLSLVEEWCGLERIP